MPDGSGVMFALATVLPFSLKRKPPAYERVAICAPCFCGVWQSPQAATVNRYFPRDIGSAAGSGTEVSSGCGALLIRCFTGKGIVDFGCACLIGWRLRTYATTEARSSSERL